MFERCNRSAGSQSCALARFVACLKQAVQASSRCKSTERGQKQETVSSPASCSGKRLPSCPPPFNPCCRTPSEGGGRSPVSRCRPEPSHSRSGPFRRPGLPGESAGPKRNGNMQSIFLHCSCVCVAVVECVFFWASEHQQTLVATYPDGHRVAERPNDQSCTSATMLCI